MVVHYDDKIVEIISVVIVVAEIVDVAYDLTINVTFKDMIVELSTVTVMLLTG